MYDLYIKAGNMVTIDTMGTQKDIVSKIVGKKADCLLGGKKNQPTLWGAIAGNMEDFERIPLPDEAYKSSQGEGKRTWGCHPSGMRVCSLTHSLGKIMQCRLNFGVSTILTNIAFINILL